MKPGYADFNEKGEQLYHAGTLTYTKSALVKLYTWLLWGDFCYFMVETVVPSIIPLKFKHLGASNFLMGIILATIPRAISFTLNPIISFRSDRFRSRWGRRIPFIVVTMPFLVLCFLGLAFAEDISHWLVLVFPALGSAVQGNMLVVIVLSVFLIAFDFFNTFVTSVFWYLFNDVVPEQFISRFMSWFRMVIMITGIVYNWLVFKHAEDSFKWIFVGAALLYLFGFGAMCLNVKEGEYPPPLENSDGGHGLVSSIKTYVRECMTLPHYWYLFLVSIFGALSGACGMFNIFFLTRSMGLTLEMVGWLGMAGSVACLIYVPISGWLADRYHPIRVVLWGMVFAQMNIPIGFIWLFWKPGPWVYFYFALVQSVLLGCPIAMLTQMMDPPLLMRIFPRERYGQFCSAKSMLGSFVGIFSGAIGGAYLDVLTKLFGEKTAYCLIPAWHFIFSGMSLYFMFRLFRSWKSYGGDESYVPPIPSRDAAGITCQPEVNDVVVTDA